jgi:hypothetical protein
MHGPTKEKQWGARKFSSGHQRWKYSCIIRNGRLVHAEWAAEGRMELSAGRNVRGSSRRRYKLDSEADRSVNIRNSRKERKSNIAGPNYRFHTSCICWPAFCPNPLSSHSASRLTVLSKITLKSPMIHREVHEHVQCYYLIFAIRSKGAEIAQSV